MECFIKREGDHIKKGAQIGIVLFADIAPVLHRLILSEAKTLTVKFNNSTIFNKEVVPLV